MLADAATSKGSQMFETIGNPRIHNGVPEFTVRDVEHGGLRIGTVRGIDEGRWQAWVFKPSGVFSAGEYTSLQSATAGLLMAGGGGWENA